MEQGFTTSVSLGQWKNAHLVKKHHRLGGKEQLTALKDKAIQRDLDKPKQWPKGTS